MSKSTYDVDPKYGERIASLEATLPHLATKKDIERLDGKIDTGFEEVKRLIESSVLQTEIKSLKRFVGIWAVIAGIGSPLAATIASFFRGG